MNQPLMLTVLGRCLFYLHALKKCSHIGALQCGAGKHVRRGCSALFGFFPDLSPILHFSINSRNIPFSWQKTSIITSKV